MSLVTERSKSKSIFGFLEKDHKKTFRNLDRFYEVLRNLRFEGKQNVGKNIEEIRELVAYFKQELDGHMKEEEKVLFPFLKSHIPRLEPMICLLLSEHKDFRSSLKNLRVSLSEFYKPDLDRIAAIHRIDEQGTYLVCLLRSHMQLETKSLYQVADKELRPGEKRKLIDQIEKNAA